MSATVHLLVGPDAGRGRAGSAHAIVTATWHEAGVEVVDLTGPDAASSLIAARAAVEAGAERLVVVGGDGLVHLGLQAVAATPTVLGVVAVGTGNDFVRGLDGFPTDPRAAAIAALSDPTPLDAIRSDGGWTASVATAGFSGDVNERANALRFPKGPSRYTVATLRELPAMRPRPVTVTVDGEAHDYESALLAVGNTAWFGGGMQICPDADPTDGLLDVTVVSSVGRLELLRFFRLVFDGRHLDHPRVHTHRGREVRLDGSDIALWGDGEPTGHLPATLTAESGAIQLAGVPQ